VKRLSTIFPSNLKEFSAGGVNPRSLFGRPGQFACPAGVKGRAWIIGLQGDEGRRIGKTLKIMIGSDHAGFGLKETCRQFLENSGAHEVQDIGVFSRESSDYPKIAHRVAKAVSRGEAERGILVCGSGLGMSMVANRYRGVRAALCHNIYSARLSRLHNDANILALGERVLGAGLALEILDVFLNTEFEEGRHKARVDQIDAVE